MAQPSYYLGEVVKIYLLATSATGSTGGVQPGALTFGLKEPDGSTYSYTLGGSTHIATASSSGYVVNWPTAKEGVHYGGWVGSGSNAGAVEFSFSVVKRLY